MKECRICGSREISFDGHFCFCNCCGYSWEQNNQIDPSMLGHYNEGLPQN